MFLRILNVVLMAVIAFLMIRVAIPFLLSQPNDFAVGAGILMMIFTFVGCIAAIWQLLTTPDKPKEVSDDLDQKSV
jgi:hypothetical protein